MADDTSPQAGPPDPGRIANQEDFGRELSLLRHQAGKTIRQVAAAAGIPPSTAGDYFTGSHLPQPSANSLLTRILAACGETDAEVIEQWLRALARARRAPGRRPADAPAPYRGPAAFQTEDAQWFFGRDDLIGLLVDLAGDRDRSTGSQASALPLVVVGPSGAGKSSLLRAGLIPALSAPSRARAGVGGPRLLLFSPGSRPLRALAGQLAGGDAAAAEAVLRADPARAAELAGQIPPPGLAVIVDQFEETFTSCRDEDDRRAFIGAVCALCSRARVVLSLRADFYARALAYPQLTQALQERQIVVGPMTQAQLRQAIVEPARLAGLKVEDGLVELLLGDLAPPAGRNGPEAAYEAGALPLLSHALLATWERARGGRLTVAAYQNSGGIKDAIGAAAETAYNKLAPDQQRRARRLFMRLIQVTDGVAVRRRIPVDEVSYGSDADVLNKFVAGRLITVDATVAQITHEALLATWPRLRGWIEADLDSLVMRRRIGEAARAWREGGREVAGLLRGGQLAIARQSAADPAGPASAGSNRSSSTLVSPTSRWSGTRPGAVTGACTVLSRHWPRPFSPPLRCRDTYSRSARWPAPRATTPTRAR